MNFSNGNTEEDMSMEDILSSIRKYVSEESDKAKDQSNTDEKMIDEEQGNIINLNASHLAGSADQAEVPQLNRDEAETYEERSSLSTSVIDSTEDDTGPRDGKKPGPFAQLTNALNSYGRKKPEHVKESKQSMTIDELFTKIAEKTIQEWVEKNMPNLVEEIVSREIEKMKSE